MCWLASLAASMIRAQSGSSGFSSISIAGPSVSPAKCARNASRARSRTQSFVPALESRVSTVIAAQSGDRAGSWQVPSARQQVDDKVDVGGGRLRQLELVVGRDVGP